MVYEWKKDATGRTSAVKAKDAGKILKRLEKKFGGVTPESVIAEALPEDSPIHAWFEWDDTVAAKHHREDQARSMIQQIVVVYKTDDNAEPQPVRAFVSIIEDKCRHYASTARVLSDTELRQQVIDDVLADITHCKAKLKSFDGFGKALVSLEKAETQIQKAKTGRGVAGRGRVRLGKAG